MDFDNDDNWFYDSMKRYKQLRMFETAHTVRHIVLSDTKNICVVGTHEKSGKDEILELVLPEKLTVPEEKNGLVKDCDLKVNKGGFAQSKILQMEALAPVQKLVTSEENQCGITIYDLSSTSSDLINVDQIYACKHMSPCLSMKGFETVLLASTSFQPIDVMDLTNGNIIQKIDVDQSHNGRIEAKYVSENVIAVCNKVSGKVIISDLRTDSIEGSYSLDAHVSTEDTSASWTLSETNEDTVDIGSSFSCISTDGMFVLYDLRTSKAPHIVSSLNLKTANPPLHTVLSRLWSESGLFSFSGFDENVYIKRISEEKKLESVFTHDGHKHGGIGLDSTVTCHLWFQGDILVSAAHDKSLHCWQFVS